MNKQTIAIIIGIFLISLASAIYPGECETVKFPNKDKVNLTIIYNTSSMEGLTWSKEGYDITYCFSTDSELGNYSFEWSNYQDDLPEPVIVHHYSGGGGRTRYRDRNITVEKIIYVNQTEEKPIELEGEKRIIWPYFFWAVFVVAIIGMWIIVLKKYKKNKNDNNSNTNL